VLKTCRGYGHGPHALAGPERNTHRRHRIKVQMSREYQKQMFATLSDWIDDYRKKCGIADVSTSEKASQEATLKLVELFSQQLFPEPNEFTPDLLEVISSWPQDFDQPLLEAYGVALEPGDEPGEYTGPRLVAAIKRLQDKKLGASSAAEGLQFKQVVQSPIGISFGPRLVCRTPKRPSR
jgi:hypothetical protein